MSTKSKVKSAPVTVEASIPATVAVVAKAKRVATVKIEKAPRAPSNVAKGKVIFAEALTLFNEGKFESKKAMRKTVIDRMMAELSTPEKPVSVASAAMMYNTAYKTAQKADESIVLGRDAKKEKPAKVVAKEVAAPEVEQVLETV